MGHAEELLAVAGRYDLSASEAEKRRCISTAYYAVFHLLIECIVGRFIPGDNVYAQNIGRRALAHTTVKEFCHQIARQGNQRGAVKAPPSWKDSGYEEDVDPAISELALILVDLHRWREIADYDLYRTIWLQDAEKQIKRARTVFEAIQGGLPEPQWTLFLASLLFRGRK